MSSMDWVKRIVQKEVSRYGFDLVIQRRMDDGEYDVTTSMMMYTTTDYPCRGLMFDYPLRSNGESTHANTLISKDDKQLFVQPPANLTDLEPERDQVVIGEVVYKVVSVRKIDPSTANAGIWELYLRK